MRQLALPSIAGVTTEDKLNWLIACVREIELASHDRILDDEGAANAAGSVATDLATETAARIAADNLLAPKHSPTLTGNPTAPTPAAGDNDTSIATTAYVQNELAALSNFAAKTQTDYIAGIIALPTNQDYKVVVKLPYALTITSVTTISTSGTCTATVKINTTALGGTANSVSTTEQEQTHSSSNVAAAGDDIVITVSANATCVNLSFTIKFTRTLA